MKHLSLLTIALILFTVSSARADGEINIRVSVKTVLNPYSGERAYDSSYGEITDTVIDTTLRTGINAFLQSYFRGYRFRLEEIVDVGGLGQFSSGPSSWFFTDFFDGNAGTQAMIDMENAAISDPGEYAWRTDAINIYFVAGISGGKCSFPTGSHTELVVVGGDFSDDADLILHEVGHYFGLCHTQGCSCGACDSNKKGVCHDRPGDDGIDDTLPDLECWFQDNIAMNSYGLLYFQLTPAQQQRVDDVFNNIMSYHTNESRLTEDQVDRWADEHFTYRQHVTDGVTWFCRYDPDPPGSGFLGRSFAPFGGVSYAVGISSPGDIAMLYPGEYDEQLVIGTPITLRATRQGSAVIGIAPSSSPIATSHRPRSDASVFGSRAGRR